MQAAVVFRVVFEFWRAPRVRCCRRRDEPCVQLIAEEGNGRWIVDAEEEGGGCGADAFEGFGEGGDGGGEIGELGEGGAGCGGDEGGGVLAEEGEERWPIGAVGSVGGEEAW